MQKRAEKPEWLRVAEEFGASGLTQREFAGRQGLRLSTVQSWVYRRRRQVSAGGELPVRLLPVQVSSVPATSESGSMEVALAGGMRVRFSPGADVDDGPGAAQGRAAAGRAASEPGGGPGPGPRGMGATQRWPTRGPDERRWRTPS